MIRHRIEVHVDLDGIILAHKSAVAIAHQLEQTIAIFRITLELDTIINGHQAIFRAFVQGKKVPVGIKAKVVVLLQTVGQLSQVEDCRAVMRVKLKEVVVAQRGVLHIAADIANEERHDALIRQVGRRIGVHLVRVETHEIDR